MTRRVLVAAHTLLVVSSVSAETIQERGKRVVMEALEALGGDKFLAMKDRVESGRAYSFYREELSGLSVARVYTQYVKPAAAGVIAVRERQSFGKGEETSAVLFTGEAAYQITFRGARPVPDDTLQRYKDGVLHNVFYILRQRLNETGLIFESAGSDVWQNQPVEIVDITDSENRVVTVSFHRSLKVPLRQLFSRRYPKTRDRIEEITAFSKYRDVGGVQWPYAIRRERDGEKIYEMFSENVQINQGLADSMFTLPGNVKILKKPD